MSTHNICFYEELMKIILQLSSNTLPICSTGLDQAEFERIPQLHVSIKAQHTVNRDLEEIFMLKEEMFKT